MPKGKLSMLKVRIRLTKVNVSSIMDDRIEGQEKERFSCLKKYVF